MKVIKLAVVVPLLLLLTYVAVPYYSAWQMMEAVKSGESNDMERYIDFPKVQASIKQQVSRAIEESSAADPLAGHMMKAFSPILDKAIDELLQADNLANFIQTQKLIPPPDSVRKMNDTDEPLDKATTKDASWSAWFTHIDQFKITVDKLALHMQLQQGRWQVVAVGVDELIDLNQSRAMADKKQAVVEEEIDTDHVDPIVDVDIDALQQSLSTLFFINNDFGNKAQIEGDFYYFPAMASLKPTVTWLNALDINNNDVLGEFSAKTLEEREKFNLANRYYKGQWSDDLPKTSSARLASATGNVTVKVPTKVIHLTLNRQTLGQLLVQENIGAHLKELSNGTVSLAYYWPFSGETIEPIIVVKNEQGLPLRQPSSFGMLPEEAIENSAFTQKMKGAEKSISVAGTPHSVDIYFPLAHTIISSNFTATPKPEVAFGELKTAIKTTRYDPLRAEPELTPIEKEDFHKMLVTGFFETTRYDEKKERFFQIILPKTPYTAFATVNYDGLTVFKDGKSLDVRQNRSVMGGNKFQVSYGEKTKDWSDIPIIVDRIKGTVMVRYPKKINKIIVRQGEMQQGIHLKGAVLSYPQSINIPRYSSSNGVRSLIAYGKEGKQIASLDDMGGRGKDRSEVLFWGEPAFVEVKQVVEWVDVDIMVDVGSNDVQHVKNRY